MTNPVRVAGALLRTFGVRGLRRRAAHELRRAGGAYRSAPAASPSEAAGRRLAIYRPAGSWSAVPADRRHTILDRGRRVVAGAHEAYGDQWRQLPASPIDWRRDPVRGFEFPDAPWFRVPHMPAGADIKHVWEPGRFAWAYDLVRAYAVGADPALAEAFHRRLREWVAANPPFRGPQWACGQETAIRALAILHAEASLPPPAPQAGRDPIRDTLSASGERIEDAIGYALSQRNNHGISEAAGLVHLGIRLEGVHPHAARWRRLGESYLDEQIRDQFAADGWHAQHSFTYTRVALEQALLAARALAAVGGSLSPLALERLGQSLDLLTHLIAPGTGVVPNHGANDGGRVVLYSTAPYRDFRPLLTLGAAVLGRSLPADVPPDPDTLEWLGVAAPAASPARRDGVTTGTSGWAVARLGGASVFLRAGAYTHRPSHLDPLHVDVRFGDREVVVDPGTYAYNAPPPWTNGLTTAFVHNGPVIDDTEPAVRGPRFLWYTWPSAAMVRAEERDGGITLVAERPGCVRREVDITAESVRIVDRVLDPAAATMQVTWLEHPDQVSSCVESVGLMPVEARDTAVDGWFSPTYGHRVPGRAWRVRRAGAAAHQPLVTVIAREPATPSAPDR